VAKVITLGSKAPDFALKDQDKKTVRLSKFKGKKVLLAFRPLAWTPVCRDHMRSLEDHFKQLERLDTVALGIGVDSMFSNRAWAEVMEIEHTRLLADFWPHGAVARLYGVFREPDGFSERANIVIDEEQKVIFAKIYPISEMPDVDEIVAFLEKRGK
jgi:peroxiredoxin